MALNLFGWLEEITNKKSPWEKFSDEDKKTFNSFMIHKYISMYEPYCEVANIVQKIDYKDKERIYKVYSNILPKKKLFLRFIGKSNKKDKISEELINYICMIYQCGTSEAEELISLLKEEGVRHNLVRLGIEEKEIKKLIKTIK